MAGEPVYGGTCVESHGQVFSSTCGGGATGCTGTAGMICVRGAGRVAGGVTTPRVHRTPAVALMGDAAGVIYLICIKHST